MLNPFRKYSIKLVLSAALILTSVFSFNGSTGIAESISNSEEAKIDQLKKNLKFRTEYGLDSNLVKINELMIDPDNNKNQFGVALTKEEEDLLVKRINRQVEKVPLIKNFLEEDPDFAWIYINQVEGTVNIGFTSELSIKKTSIDTVNKMYGDSSIKVHKARISNQELKKIYEKIISDWTGLLDRGIPLKAFGINIPEERIDMYLSTVTEDNIAVLEKMYPKEYLHFEEYQQGEFDASRSDKLRPLEGGTKLLTSGKNPCSTGFVAKDSGGSQYLITAGHCGEVDELFYQGPDMTSTNFIGISSFKQFGDKADALAISIPSSLASKYVFKNDSQDLTLTSSQPSNSDVVGNSVCIAGITSGYSCGTITNVDYSFYDLVMFNHVRKASYTSAGGDSGSPVFSGSVLIGVHFYSHGVFSAVSAILNYFGMTF